MCIVYIIIYSIKEEPRTDFINENKKRFELKMLICRISLENFRVKNTKAYFMRPRYVVYYKTYITLCKTYFKVNIILSLLVILLHIVYYIITKHIIL